MIKTVVFDLGGVLIDWNPDYLYKKLFSNQDDLDWFYKHVCTFEWNEEQDAGRSLESATNLLISQFPDHEEMIRAYYDRWEEMLKGPIQESVDILHHLKQRGNIRLYALTNWSAETFPIALARYDFLHWFEGIVVSGTEKTRKPFPDIYHTLVERYAIDATSAVYTDDNPRNLVPAAKMGMQTIHFQSPQQLKSALKAFGLV